MEFSSFESDFARAGKPAFARHPGEGQDPVALHFGLRTRRQAPLLLVIPAKAGIQ